MNLKSKFYELNIILYLWRKIASEKIQDLNRNENQNEKKQFEALILVVRN